MGRVQAALFLALLIALGSATLARAQGPIAVTSTAALEPQVPRRLLFTLEASSSAGDLTEARLYYRPASAVARISERVLFAPAPTVSLSYEWEMQRNGVPPGTPIEYYWRVRDSAGNEMESAPQTLIALDPRFAWQTVQDEELAIHWYDGDAAWGQAMFDTGKQALAELEAELGADIQRQVTLVAYTSDEDFRGAFPVQQDWIGGQAFPPMAVTVQIISPGDDEWMRTVLFHELSHLVFHQALDGALAVAPTWLDEGLAMYNEPEGRDSESRVRRAAQSGELLPYSAMQGNFGADGAVVSIAYAQSEMMVAYLIDQCGRPGFQAVIQNLVDDMTVDEALTAACGLDSRALYDAWRQTLPNAPTPGSPEPAPAAPGWPMTLRLFILANVCLMGVSLVSIVAIVVRLLRARQPAGAAPRA